MECNTRARKINYVLIRSVCAKWFVLVCCTRICLLTIFILAREVLKRWRLNYRLENNDETLLTDSSVKIEVLTSAPEGSSFVESVPAILIENIE